MRSARKRSMRPLPLLLLLLRCAGSTTCGDDDEACVYTTSSGKCCCESNSETTARSLFRARAVATDPPAAALAVGANATLTLALEYLDTATSRWRAVAWGGLATLHER